MCMYIYIYIYVVYMYVCMCTCVSVWLYIYKYKMYMYKPLEAFEETNEWISYYFQSFFECLGFSFWHPRIPITIKNK